MKFAFVREVRRYLEDHGYIEIEDEEKWAQSADTEINRKWWKYMAPLMRVNPDDSPVSDNLRCVFHLD